MTEREYRALNRDSYSTVKDFIESRRKYFRKHVSGEGDDEPLDDKDSIVFGSLVDCLLFSPDEKDARFVVADFQLPTGQMLDFTKALYKRTVEYTTPEGRVTKEFTALCEEAYKDVAFDGNGQQVAFKQKGMTVQKVIERFSTEGADYYAHLRNNQGKLVIEVGDEVAAEAAIRELRTSFATRAVINARTIPGQIEVHDQLVILWEYRGLEMKSMLDRVIVNHTEKKVFAYDLKTAWNVDGFHYNYLKLKYYIQVACYGAALLKWVEEMGLQDYEVVPMQFIVVDNTGISSPLVFQTTDQHLRDAIEGFTVNGKHYCGLRKAVDDLRWHHEMGLWTISRDNYDNRGIVTLNYAA